MVGDIIMAESMLKWMQQHEVRYQTKKKSNQKPPSKQIEPVRKTSNDPQRRLDAFFSHSHTSPLFDETFNESDFKLATQRWIEKNMPELAAN